ncbi:HNH endonuclease [Dermabacteraceae bacterium P13077]
MSTYRRQRERVWVRDHGLCVVCGRPGGSVHHRQGRGGPEPHRLANLLLVCGDGVTGCHGRIHADPATAYERGWMVYRHRLDKVEDVPVSTFRGLVLFSNDGTARFLLEDEHGPDEGETY